jgi:purine-binding chemotaxis protein CheW
MAVEGPSPGQWLVLCLDDREYALAVANVVEVLRMVAVTPLAEAPAWIAGVINLRGKGIVVADLRARLGLPLRAPDLDMHIVVVEAGGEPFGLIADDVVEILALPRAALSPADRLPGTPPLFAALAHAGERLIPVFDLERLVRGATFSQPAGAAHAGS